MDLKAFLERVLPTNGSDYYGAVESGGKLRQAKLNDLSELEKYIRSHVSNNVYYATGSYRGGRKQENAELRKSLFMDLDCGAGDNKFPSKREAAKELYTFCKTAFLPPSILVDSGGGLHAYWTLDSAIPSAKWVPLAKALKDLCEIHDFKADPAVTADAARILRAPDTINFKRDKPQPVKIIKADGADYTLAELRASLSVMTSAPVLALAVNNDDLSMGLHPDTKRYAKHMVRECPMYAEALDTGGFEVPEPLWNQQLHLLAFCEDGEEYAHKISEKYIGYARSETQMKWNQKLAQKEKYGPTRCSTFSEHYSKCKDCPFWEQITTPLQLGDDRDHMLPWPYNQDDDGVFTMIPGKDEKGDSVMDRSPVTDFRISEFAVVRGDDGLHLIFTAHIAKGKRRVEIEYATVQDKHKVIGEMSRYGVVLSRHECHGFGDFMTAWTKRMQSQKREQRMWPQLGWVSNPRGFAIASKIILEDGREEKNVHTDRRMAAMYEPTGSRDPWIEIAYMLTQQKRHATDAMIVTAFAAPLLEFVRDPAPIVGFVSQRSGTGKTTAMQVAQAVWGNPRTAMNQLDDTTASLFNKMGYLNNLPAYWDEVRVKDEVQKFVRSIFQLTNGKERARLTQDAKQRDAGSWNTLLTVASNESIADHAMWASKGSEAGRARVFEINVPVIEEKDRQHNQLNAAMLKLFSNHGVIGEEYAKYLAQNRDMVEKEVTDLYEGLSKKLMRTSAERFWLTTLTVMVAGARLSNRLKYTQIDLSSFARWMGMQYRNQRTDEFTEMESPESGAVDAIMEFLAANRTQIIIADYLTRQGRTDIGDVYTDPKGPKMGEIAAVVALKDNMIRLNRGLFTEYLYKKTQLTPKAVLDNVISHAIRGKLNVVEPSDFTRVRCWDIAIKEEWRDTFEAMASATDSTE